MTRYSEERKQAVLAKLLPPHNLSIQALAEQEGISVPTLYAWRKRARAQGRCLPDSDVTGPASWPSRDKFAAVVETAALNAEERSEYCRRRGLYVEQLAQWRSDCEQAADLAQARRDSQTQAYREQAKQLKEVQRELRRKEAALAETAALLALRKKRRRSGGRQRTHDQHPGSPSHAVADRRGPLRRRPHRQGLCGTGHCPSH